MKKDSNVLLRLMLFFSVFIFSSFSYSFYDYVVVIDNPNDGVFIKVNSNSTISDTPSIASNGEKFYFISPAVVLKNFGEGVSVRGKDTCYGYRIPGSDIPLPIVADWNRLFVYIPFTGIKINGLKLYKLSDNIYLTIETSTVSIEQWTRERRHSYCSFDYPYKKVAAEKFIIHYPLTFRFYVKRRIVDDQIFIPKSDFASYVLYWGKAYYPPNYNSWDYNRSTLPFHLQNSILYVKNHCKTSSYNLNIEHGVLNNLNYDSEKEINISYTCDFSLPTDVNFSLQYTTDGDPQGRLPMVNSKNSKDKIYSDLFLVNKLTGEKGKQITASITNRYELTIHSHLQGTNATAGNYAGQAWLIASFD